MCTSLNSEVEKGDSTDLMPSIMSIFDEILNNGKSSQLKRTNQCRTFAHFSPGLQKLISNIPDKEINKSFSSEESLCSRRFIHTSNRSYKSNDKYGPKSKESFDIMTPNVQKIISNLPDTELVLTSNNILEQKSNRSLSHLENDIVPIVDWCSNVSESIQGTANIQDLNSTLYKITDFTKDYNSDVEQFCTTNNKIFNGDEKSNFINDEVTSKPLGKYYQRSKQGIASRIPVGRKTIGKYSQIMSGSSIGTTNSTNSSEVSRPISLTSLGSCSSSDSSCDGGEESQPSSAYLASVESLDLDSDLEPSGSQDSADSGVGKQSITNPELRVLQEVLDTETAYVRDLKEVIEGYLERWESEENCPLAPYLNELFSNIKDIYIFNQQFLTQLKSFENNSTKLANVFLQNDSGFQVYNQYCTNYPITMDVLSNLTRNEDIVFLVRQRQSELGHVLPLGSYLLKPVQRILKYHLLLQRLSKQCDIKHKPAVNLALTTMTAVASDINLMKGKHEHAVRVQEIQAQLYGWNGEDLTALGELIAEGTFRIVGARARRHVFLFDKVLLITKPKQDGFLAYKFHIMCSNLMLVEQIRGELLSFQVLPFDNPRLQCTLKARSPQHKREWTLQIKRVILENYSAVIPNHVRQLVLELGQEINKTNTVIDKWSPLKQFSTPHYLERRSKVHKIRSFANRRTSSQDRKLLTLTNWKRKSDSDMTPSQYTIKNIPHKISKLKRAKETASTFYADLSEFENSETCNESTERLDNSPQETDTHFEDNLKSVLKGTNSSFREIGSDVITKEFVKPKNHEFFPKIRFEDSTKFLTRANSLPRSFELNVAYSNEKNCSLPIENSLKQKCESNSEGGEQSTLTSNLDEQTYPQHRIYRKSSIRVSLFQKIRSLLSEQQKPTQNYSLCKQGSKTMGKKIANPDYCEPKKVFGNSFQTLSNLNLSLEKTNLDCDFLDEPEKVDVTLGQTEVLNEFNNRLQHSFNQSFLPFSGTQSIMPEPLKSVCSFDTNKLPSHCDDSYYENILENNLKEEYIKIDEGEFVTKQNSFKTANKNNYVLSHESEKTTKSNRTKKYPLLIVKDKEIVTNKKNVTQRPTIAPPPIPIKPTHLLPENNKGTRYHLNNWNIKHDKSKINETIIDDTTLNNFNLSFSNKSIGTSSWVKAMVGRFE